MQNIFKCKINLVIIALFLWSNVLLAQDPGEDPGDFGGDPGAPAAPIDNWIPLLLLIGIGIVFYLTYKKKSVTN